MKKQIKYSSGFGIAVGQSAALKLEEDHPSCITRNVWTSEIVSVEANGNFETLNTNYVKVDANG